jgi:NAD(P)-dependent dehydrogenase (short-subunit alcohol dehydrogenase family)
VAIVTGGAGLLGIQHCEALLKAGAKVYVADVDNEKIAKACGELGKNAFPLFMDITEEKDIKSALKLIIQDHIQLDILVNNAAIDPKVKSNTVEDANRLEDYPIEQWDQHIKVGLTGAFLCSKVFGTHMALNAGGCILNIASDLSVIAPDQRIYRQNHIPEELQTVKPVTYSVVKTGLIGLTRYMAAYWADKKIRVNALSPGGVFNNQPDEFVTRLTNLIPLSRMAEINEYQSAIQFLCSDASSYMTGQNIVMDGGRSII